LTKLNRKNIWAGVVGNTFEWYDFALFGSFASTISSLFFPEDAPQVALLKSYGIFATGFIMRPLGSIFFGFIGDTRGRKTSLFLSIICMLIPTISVGFLPTYTQIGLWAPCLLIFIRLLQGFAMGGEYGGSMVFLYEHSPPHRKGFFSSWADVGCLLGVLIGTFLSWALLNFMDHKTFISWGWRLPFIGSLLLACIVLYFRHKIDETETFESLKNNKKIINITNGSLGLLKKIGIAVCVYAFGNVSFFVFLVFIPNYFVQTHSLYARHSLLVTSFMSLLIAIIIPLGGYLSDTWGRIRVMTISIIICTLITYPMFYSMAESNSALNFLLQGLFAVSLAFFYGAEAAFLSELFQSELRCRGVSISLSLTNILFGGSAPFVASWITYQFGNVQWVSFLIILAALLALISLSMRRMHYAKLFASSTEDSYIKL
jgi:MFS transporter, MHS family, proline/betaine transporter